MSLMHSLLYKKRCNYHKSRHFAQIPPPCFNVPSFPDFPTSNNPAHGGHCG